MLATTVKLIQKYDGLVIDRWLGHLWNMCRNVLIVESRW